MARTRHAPGQGSWLLSLRRMVLAGSFGRGRVVLRWRLRSPAVDRGTYAPNDRLRQHQWRRRPGSRCLRLTSHTPGRRRNAAVFCHPANPPGAHTMARPWELDQHTIRYEATGKPGCCEAAT